VSPSLISVVAATRPSETIVGAMLESLKLDEPGPLVHDDGPVIEAGDLEREELRTKCSAAN
jgi:hypothetical protein